MAKEIKHRLHHWGQGGEGAHYKDFHPSNSTSSPQRRVFGEGGSGDLPFLKCFTGSDSRSKNNWISSGWVPARNRKTMAMRVPEADLPWVLLPVLFFIRPYKILKSQKSIILTHVRHMTSCLSHYRSVMSISKDFNRYKVKGKGKQVFRKTNRKGKERKSNKTSKLRVS